MMKYPIFSLASTLLAVPFFTLSAQAVPLTPALKARFRDLNEKGFPIYNTSTGGWTLGMAPEAKLVGCLQVLGLDDAGREVKPVGRVEPGTEVDLPQGTVLLLGPTAPRAGVMAAGKSFRAPLVPAGRQGDPDRVHPGTPVPGGPGLLLPVRPEPGARGPGTHLPHHAEGHGRTPGVQRPGTDHPGTHGTHALNIS